VHKHGSQPNSRTKLLFGKKKRTAGLEFQNKPMNTAVLGVFMHDTRNYSVGVLGSDTVLSKHIQKLTPGLSLSFI
jgi:hypothetical protein